MTAGPAWMTASAAAARLHVSRATLYAYVSRGLIRSQPIPGSTRTRAYARDDVDRLRHRSEARRDPSQAAAHALEWGIPVLESAITFIDGRALYYRGHDAVALARTRRLEEIASLVWTGDFGRKFPAPVAGRVTSVAAGFPAGASFITRAQTLLAAAAARDDSAADLRAVRVADAGWGMLSVLTDAAIGAGTAPNAAIETRLARAWRVGAAGADLIRAILILLADHELNVSSFTARCVASAGSTPYAVVIAGLSALEGFRHGGAGARVEAMLSELRAEAGRLRRVDRARLRRALAARLRRGDSVGGFGHPLYPGGDPRAIALLQMLRERLAENAELAYVEAVAHAAGTLMHEAPNIDFMLAAAARALRLPKGAALMLFAIGRTIGWIGQAIEQYATGQLIRPRARYVGVTPP